MSDQSRIVAAKGGVRAAFSTQTPSFEAKTVAHQPAAIASPKGAAPRPGHERNLLSPPCGDLPVGLFLGLSSLISDFPKNISVPI